MKTLSPIVLVLLGVCCLAADETKDNAKLIQGKWLAESVRCAGQPCEAAAGLKCKIAKDTIAAKYGDNEIKVSYKLNAKKPNNQIEVSVAGVVAWTGIYALQDDTLKLCVVSAGESLPDELVTKAGDGRVLLVLKRQADADD